MNKLTKKKFPYHKVLNIPQSVLVSQKLRRAPRPSSQHILLDSGREDIGMGTRCTFLEGPKYDTVIELPDNAPVSIVYIKSTQVLEIHGESEQAVYDMRTLVINSLRGVSQGYRIRMYLRGVGYHAYLEANTVVLSLADEKLYFMSYDMNKVHIEIFKSGLIMLRSSTLAHIQEFASLLRSYCPPDPSSKEGIFYEKNT